MELAVEVWSGDVDRVIATARRADELGLDGFRYGESPTRLHLDCWTILAAVARETRRIRIGPVVANLLADYRSPLLLARQAATVAALSGGRLDFATGAGAATGYGRAWWEPFGIGYPGYDERLTELARLLPRLRRWWSGGVVEAGAGEPVTLGLVHPPIPITVAATGDRAMTIAAAAADVWEASFRTPDEYRNLATRFEVLASERASTRPIVRALEIDGFVGTIAGRAAAVEAAARADRSGEDVDRIMERALLGEPARVADRMGELAAAGVERLLVALHDPHDPDALEALAAARALL